MQRVQVSLVDDLDQSAADETVRWGLDGREYEIDLNHKHASELRKLIKSYADHARKVVRGRGRPSALHRSGTQIDREQSRAIRQWAKDRGLQVPDRGRIPESIRNDYAAAHRAAAAVPFRSPTAEPESAANGSTVRMKPPGRRRPARGSEGHRERDEAEASPTKVHADAPGPVRRSPGRSRNKIAEMAITDAAKVSEEADDHHLNNADRKALAAIQEHGTKPRFSGSVRVLARLESWRLIEHDTQGAYWLTEHGRQHLTNLTPA